MVVYDLKKKEGGGGRGEGFFIYMYIYACMGMDGGDGYTSGVGGLRWMGGIVRSMYVMSQARSFGLGYCRRVGHQ